jgi:hypothetical protein
MNEMNENEMNENEMNEPTHRIGRVISDVGEMLSLPSSIEWPPFFFHYIIACICVLYIICVCVLKFKYSFWYSQPITFQFTLRRFLRGNGSMNTSIMNPLSLGERYNTLAVVYPFLHFVDHKSVIVYGGGGGDWRVKSIADAPYEKLATFLSRREIVMPGRRYCIPNGGDDLYIPPDKFEYILSQETHGLSVFIGVLIGNANDDIKGVSILTPRIMLSFGGTKTSQHQSVSIYVCDHLAWANYITSERESLELLETTEYIQKSREIAGEQTLYRYREIPGFVVPFTTVYTYTFSGIVPASTSASLGDGFTLIPVSSVNFALFYAFVNECARDFRYCIFNEITQLQSLIQGGVYMIYMLVLNQVRVVSAYIFESSWMKVRPMTRWNMKMRSKPKKTRGNRISALHDHICQTSTAVIKYLPPAIRPRYDALGKRIKVNDVNTNTKSTYDNLNESPDILLLKSSIRHKMLCGNDLFVRGFVAATIQSESSSSDTIVCIDTIAHNYQIIDVFMTTTTASKFISQEKWYYILYNAIIHQEVLCKDILLI